MDDERTGITAPQEKTPSNLGLGQLGEFIVTLISLPSRMFVAFDLARVRFFDAPRRCANETRKINPLVETPVGWEK